MLDVDVKESLSKVTKYNDTETYTLPPPPLPLIVVRKNIVIVFNLPLRDTSMCLTKGRFYSLL